MNSSGITPSTSDSDLLARFRRGDNDAATELYAKYAERLQILASRQTGKKLGTQLEADDVVQSVFRTFFRRVTEGFFDVPPSDEIWNLFLVIALNKIRRTAAFYSRKKRDISVQVPLNAAVEVEHADETPFAALQMTVDELLDGVSDQHRKMIEMRIQAYELRDIAAEVRRSSRTVERVLKQFRDKLSRQIDEP
ncbi:MAG: hypothetical protein KDB27_14715 [Planctomycetales bacterium]|nr:hypothetical protein [Planctomycetales bacterium]